MVGSVLFLIFAIIHLGMGGNFRQLVDTLFIAPVLGLGTGFGLSPVGGLVGGLLGLLKREPPTTPTFPNQGIVWSLYTALLMGIAGFLVSGLVAWPFVPWVDVITVALITGSLLGLWYGLDVLQHYVLRFVLWTTGRLPWNLVRFLEHVTERAFLRRDAGGYAFIHAPVRDYFASL
jgi:MFS family permease